MSSRVEFDLADSVFTRLAELAESRGESVAELMATNAYRIARLSAQADDVGVLWAQGLTDAQIAKELGWTNSKVARTRQARLLKANRKLRGN